MCEGIVDSTTLALAQPGSSLQLTASLFPYRTKQQEKQDKPVGLVAVYCTSEMSEGAYKLALIACLPLRWALTRARLGAASRPGLRRTHISYFYSSILYSTRKALLETCGNFLGADNTGASRIQQLTAGRATY